MVVVNSDTQQGGSPSSCWWKNFLSKIDWSSIDKKYFAPRNVDWKTEFSNNFLTIYKRFSSAKKMMWHLLFVEVPHGVHHVLEVLVNIFNRFPIQKLLEKMYYITEKLFHLKLEAHLLLLVVTSPMESATSQRYLKSFSIDFQPRK